MSTPFLGRARALHAATVATSISVEHRREAHRKRHTQLVLQPIAAREILPERFCFTPLCWRVDQPEARASFPRNAEYLVSCSLLLTIAGVAAAVAIDAPTEQTPYYVSQLTTKVRSTIPSALAFRRTESTVWY